MDERGLLDLTIARLGSDRLNDFSFREKLLLCGKFKTEQEFFRQSASEIESIIGRKLTAPWNLEAVRLLAQRDATQSQLKGIDWVSWHSRNYPPLLREIYDPPVVLFYRGSLPNPEKPLAAIVGTRKPSPQAAAQAYRIAHDLASAKVSVVSGLALGIDAMVHKGNLEGGAPTVAVLGSGLDKVYPSTNRTLARRILETGGCLLSEYPPGAGPRKWHFPARNRIISGLARGVLIVEAPEKSGALITARFALEHNRELWVAACGLAEDNGRWGVVNRSGGKKLALEGAGIIQGASDILEAWNMEANSVANADGGLTVVGQQLEANSGAAIAASLAQQIGVAL